ncbi:MAG: TraB/GumN family protein [Muribaculaceae bacterium]|nr:TraB/GumN family protein [Muribaculaceae bacterium]
MKKFILFLATVILLGINCKAQIFYKISGNGLEKPSYIFGTHHLAPLSILDQYNMDAYFDLVDQIVAELDLTQDQMAIAMAMQPYMLAPADSTLSKVISPEDFAEISETFKQYSPIPGVELSMFEPMKPAVVTTNVTVGIMAKLLPDFNPEQQLDTYFMITGADKDKEIIGLETPEFQAEQLFNFTPISQQAKDLVELLKDPEKNIDKAKELNEAYMAGDLNAIEALKEDEDDDDFEQILVVERNREWLKKLPGIMADGPSLIVVGALHLPGEEGVLTGLRTQGYTITPIMPGQPVEH